MLKICHITSLTQASETSRTWIITNGSNCGAAKCAGDVKEGQMLKWENDRPEESLNCIGIAPWGYVDQSDKLIEKEFYKVCLVVVVVIALCGCVCVWGVCMCIK